MPTKEYDLLRVLATQPAVSAAPAQAPAGQSTVGDTAVQPEKDSLAYFNEFQTNLVGAKKSLVTIIDSVSKNPSLLNSIATSYGELPLWKKLILVGGLFTPAFVAALWSNISGLIVLTGMPLIGTALLQDHHNGNVSNTAQVKDAILPLANLLELTIKSLDTLREKLAAEVGKFKEENLKLSDEVGKLQNEVFRLSGQTDILIDTVKELNTQKKEIAEQIEKLKLAGVEQQKVIAEKEKKLSLAVEACELTNVELSKNVAALASAREKMDSAVGQSALLAKAVTALSAAMVNGNDQQVVIQQQVGAVDEKSKLLNQVVVSIQASDEEHAKLRAELKASNDRYAQLLEVQKQQMERMLKLETKRKALDAKVAEPVVVPAQVPAQQSYADSVTTTISGLISGVGNGFGFFATKPTATPAPVLENLPEKTKMAAVADVIPSPALETSAPIATC